MMITRCIQNVALFLTVILFEDKFDLTHVIILLKPY